MTKVILLIDDDNIQHYITKVLLKKVNSEIQLISYFDANEALKYLEENEIPKFILLDLDMPIMDGWQFLDLYINLKKKTDVYIVSSSIDLNDIKKSKEYEVVKQFLSKPLNTEKMNLILDLYK